jgi:hypothetical protein
MKFDQITFYPAAVEGKTFKEFCEHEKHWKLSKEKMREIYDLLKGTKQQQDIKGEFELPDSDIVTQDPEK